MDLAHAFPGDAQEGAHFFQGPPPMTVEAIPVFNHFPLLLGKLFEPLTE